MHALAFHLRGTRIISLYEHHTGEISREQIEDFTERLIAGTLPHEDVFNTKGHGVFYAPGENDAPPSRTDSRLQAHASATWREDHHHQLGQRIDRKRRAGQLRRR
jgi:hypothetical protein